MKRCSQGQRLNNKDKGFSQSAYWDHLYNDLTPEDISIKEGENFYPFHYKPRQFFYLEDFFVTCIKGIHHKRIISIGGGIDKIGIYLAKRGNLVTMVEISDVAIHKTLILAKQMNVESNIQINKMDWQASNLHQHADVVIAHDVLHHMDWEKSIDNVFLALKEGGVYISVEPVCLLKCIKFLHKRFPFRSAPYLISQDVELSNKNIDYIRKKFSKVEVSYFDVFTRASVTYILYKLGFRKIIRFLSRMDFFLIRLLPFLKPFSSYVVIKAYK